MKFHDTLPPSRGKQDKLTYKQRQQLLRLSIILCTNQLIKVRRESNGPSNNQLIKVRNERNAPSINQLIKVRNERSEE